MDFNIETGSIQRAIKLLSVVVKINALDTTGMVCIKAFGSGVAFSANNGLTNILIRANNVDVKEEGSSVVLYSKIKSFISSFKPYDKNSGVKSFRIKSDSKNTTILVDNLFNNVVAKSRLTVTSLNTTDLQSIESLDKIDFSLNSSVVLNALDKVLYAVNPQVGFNQPALRGMNIKFDEEYIYFAGSDGIVLSEFTTSNTSGFSGTNVTLNYDFVMGLRRLIGNDTQLMWEIQKGNVIVMFDDVVFTGARIYGNDFPEYRPAFDKFTHQIEIEKSFFVNSIVPFVDILDPDDHFRVTLEIKDKLFKLYGPQANFEAELDIQPGLDFSIDLNGRVLVQTLESVKDDVIVFKFSDSDGFAIFDGASSNSQKSLITNIRKR